MQSEISAHIICKTFLSYNVDVLILSLQCWRDEGASFITCIGTQSVSQFTSDRSSVNCRSDLQMFFWVNHSQSDQMFTAVNLHQEYYISQKRKPEAKIHNCAHSLFFIWRLRQQDKMNWTKLIGAKTRTCQNPESQHRSGWRWYWKMRIQKRALKKQTRQTTRWERAGLQRLQSFFGVFFINSAESACLLVKHGCRVESESHWLFDIF